MSKIAVIGDNTKMAIRAIKIMSENDIVEKIKYKSKQGDVIIMSNGTYYKALSINNDITENLRGYHFDQIITVGSVGLLDIEMLKKELTQNFVDFECQIQHYNYY